MQSTPAAALRAPQTKPVRLAPRPLPVTAATPRRAPETKAGELEVERQAFECELKLVGDGADGRVEGYASVFGLLDRGGDIVMPGAFKATLAEWRKKKQLPPMLWQHDTWAPVGVWTDLVEDEKGLKVVGQLVLEVPQAAAARALLKAKAVTGLSIGYRTSDSDIDRATGARHLKKVDLWEISLVTFPMLPEAQISGVKTFDPRALEAQLRADLNLSGAAAKNAVAIVKKHLREGGREPEPESREGIAELLMATRKATEAFRV